MSTGTLQHIWVQVRYTWISYTNCVTWIYANVLSVYMAVFWHVLIVYILTHWTTIDVITMVCLTDVDQLEDPCNICPSAGFLNLGVGFSWGRGTAHQLFEKWYTYREMLAKLTYI